MSSIGDYELLLHEHGPRLFISTVSRGSGAHRQCVTVVVYLRLNTISFANVSRHLCGGVHVHTYFLPVHFPDDIVMALDAQDFALDRSGTWGPGGGRIRLTHFFFSASRNTLIAEAR